MIDTQGNPRPTCLSVVGYIRTSLAIGFCVRTLGKRETIVILYSVSNEKSRKGTRFVGRKVK